MIAVVVHLNIRLKTVLTTTRHYCCSSSFVWKNYNIMYCAKYIQQYFLFKHSFYCPFKKFDQNWILEDSPVFWKLDITTKQELSSARVNGTWKNSSNITTSHTYRMKGDWGSSITTRKQCEESYINIAPDWNNEGHRISWILCLFLFISYMQLSLV